MYIASNQQGIEIERSPTLEFCIINDLGGSTNQLLVNCVKVAEFPKLVLIHGILLSLLI